MQTKFYVKLLSIALVGTFATNAAEKYSELPGLTDSQVTALDHYFARDGSFTLKDDGIIHGIFNQYRSELQDLNKIYWTKKSQGMDEYDGTSFTLLELLAQRLTGIRLIPTPNEATKSVFSLIPQNAKDALERFAKGDGSFTLEDKQTLREEILEPGAYLMSEIAEKALEKQENGEGLTSLEKLSLAHDLVD